MKLLIIGPQASGKGTQAGLIAKGYGIPHISMGDIFREHIHNETSLGQQASSYINKGKLVPDDLTVGLITDRLQQSDCHNGWLLDGFPRTLSQAEALDDLVKVDGVVVINLSDDVCIERISGRYVHEESGRTYNVNSSPKPKKIEYSPNGTVLAAYDDITGDGLVQRDDDKPDAVLTRLAVYHEQTEPIIEFYREHDAVKLVAVDGNNTIENIFSQIKRELDSIQR